jgi:hypothetical protein
VEEQLENSIDINVLTMEVVIIPSQEENAKSKKGAKSIAKPKFGLLQISTDEEGVDQK